MKLTHIHIPAPVRRRIAVLADFHSANRAKQNAPTHIKGILAMLREAAPDLILVPGDCFNHTNTLPLDSVSNKNGLRLLCGVRKIAPVYYSIGNHEQGMSRTNQNRLEDNGIVVLDNETATIDGGIVLGGMTSGYRMDKRAYRVSPSPDTAFPKQLSERTGYKILLSHHPEYWPRFIRGYGIDLTISGHAHGGQWGFFSRGVYAPGQGLFPQYVHGLHSYEAKGNVENLVISRGMTNTVPVPRFFNPCEILLLELGKTES